MSIWKVCSRCGENKLKVEFYASKGRHKDGKMPYCKACMKEASWRQYWAKEFGLDQAGMDALLDRLAEGYPDRQ